MNVSTNIAAGFSLLAKAPIDVRFTVVDYNTLINMDAEACYNGLLSYVVADEKYYYYSNGTWHEFKAGSDGGLCIPFHGNHNEAPTGTFKNKDLYYNTSEQVLYVYEIPDGQTTGTWGSPAAPKDGALYINIDKTQKRQMWTYLNNVEIQSGWQIIDFPTYKSFSYPLDKLTTSVGSTTLIHAGDLRTVDGRQTIDRMDVQENCFIIDADNTVGRVLRVDRTLKDYNDYIATVETLITHQYMPPAPDEMEFEILNEGARYKVDDVIETTTPDIFCIVTAVGANGEIEGVTETDLTTVSTSGTNGQIAYDQRIFAGYGKNWAAVKNISKLVAQTLVEDFTFEISKGVSIEAGGSGYKVNDILKTTVSVSTDVEEYAKITQIDTNGAVLGALVLNQDEPHTVVAHGTGAVLKATGDTTYKIPAKTWNKGLTLIHVTNEAGASVMFKRTGDETTKYAIGANATIYKFVFNPDYGTIAESKSALEIDLTAVKEEVLKSVYPVNSIYLSMSSTNPGAQLGGTWIQVAQGRYMVGVGTSVDSNSYSKAYGSGNNSGFHRYKLTTGQMPSHTHVFTGVAVTTESASTTYPKNATWQNCTKATSNYWNVCFTLGNTGENHTHTVTAKGNNATTGSGDYIEKNPPYFGVYVWRRTA